MKKTAVSLLVTSVLVSTPAAARGLDYAIGANGGYDSFQYEDDDGKTDSESRATPIRLFGELEVDKVNRVVVGWRAIDFDIDATVSGDMGATFEGHQIDASWLRNIRLAREFKPWLGLGMRTTALDVKGKHTVDKDGYLANRYEATSETQVALMLQGLYEWQISKSGWFINSSVTYDVPFGDGFEGFGLGLGIKSEL